MKKSILLLITISLFAFSCEDDALLPTDLNGEWVLISFSCFCPPEAREIEVGNHIWTIDVDTKKVIVENKDEEDTPSALFASGEYTISISDSTLSMDGSSFDFYFEDNLLVLSDHPELDGPIFTFMKKSDFIKKSTDSCDVKAIVSEDMYTNGPNAFHMIESVELKNHCLYISYSSSGCSGVSWEVQLVDEGVVMESFPVQKNIRIALTNNEACQAVFQKDVWVNISPLQVNGESKINFNLEGWDEQILYEY